MKRHIRRIVTVVTAAVLAVTGLVTVIPAAQADQPAGYITMSLDLNVLGAGMVYDPVKMAFQTGENCADLTARFLGAGNFKNNGTTASSFYLSKVRLPRDITVNVPQIVADAAGSLDPGPSTAGSMLSEFDYSWASGWMYTRNGVLPNVGVSECYPDDGDVLRWQFTVYGYGADLGAPDTGWGSQPLFVSADKDPLTALIGEINSAPNKADLLAKPGAQAAYDAAYAALTNLTVTQPDIDTAHTALNQALAAPVTPPRPPSSVDVSAQLEATLAKMVAMVPEPGFGTTAGEWTVLSLARGGYAVPDGYFENYYDRVSAEVTDANQYPNTPQLHSAKSTENSRLIVGFASIGKDSRDVNGLNMTLPLSDMTYLPKQGINGPIWALIALDTMNYEMPSITDFKPTADPANQATRQRIIDWILAKEIKAGTPDAGGFALSGTTPDPDMTAMALQALAPYKDQPAVAGVIDRSVTVLSSIQNSSGGYTSWGSVNAESISQVIVALTALGIDPATDSRFVKPQGNTVTALLDFFVPGGGFRHTIDGDLNPMATDQGAYGLVAYDRFVKGMNSLYDMTDAINVQPPTGPAGDGAITLAGPDQVSSVAGTSFNVSLRTNGWPEGTYRLIDGVINVPEELAVTDVTPGSRLTGGTLTWNIDESDHKLRFVYTNTNYDPVVFDDGDWPADVLTLTLQVVDTIDVSSTPDLDITVGGMTAKTDSSTQHVFDISQAIHTVGFSLVVISVTELFTGDGIDLIPATTRAVAVSFSGVQTAGTAPAYGTGTLVSSPELTAKKGMPTYVLFTTPATTGSELTSVASYTFPSGTSPEIIFGDTDTNGLLNAQDALNAISAWIRVNPITTNTQIAAYNVTSDARINTFDALSIMENYVSGREFPITMA